MSASRRLKDSLPRAGCLLLGVCLGVWSGVASALTVSGLAFHSMPWQVSLPTLPEGLTAADLQAQLQDQLDAVNDRLSSWQPETELMRLNRAPAGICLPTSTALRRELSVALAISQASHGAYDPTVAPLVALWGFGPVAVAPYLPSRAALAAARAQVGWRYVTIDDAAGCVCKHRSLTLDLASLGEGAGVDALAAYLATRGITNYLAGIAGTLRAEGHPAPGRCWQVALEQPDGRALPEQRLSLCTAASVSTSGNYRNYRLIAGHRYAHTLDARTGWPVRHRGVSVSVVAAGRDATTTDAWTTALNVLGPQAGMALARREGLAARFLQRNRAAGGWSVLATPSFSDTLAAP